MTPASCAVQTAVAAWPCLETKQGDKTRRVPKDLLSAAPGLRGDMASRSVTEVVVSLPGR